MFRCMRDAGADAGRGSGRNRSLPPFFDPPPMPRPGCAQPPFPIRSSPVSGPRGVGPESFFRMRHRGRSRNGRQKGRLEFNPRHHGVPSPATSHQPPATSRLESFFMAELFRCNATMTQDEKDCVKLPGSRMAQMRNDQGLTQGGSQSAMSTPSRGFGNSARGEPKTVSGTTEIANPTNLVIRPVHRSLHRLARSLARQHRSVSTGSGSSRRSGGSLRTRPAPRPRPPAA